jgi:nucleoid-associated protein YgaU
MAETDAALTLLQYDDTSSVRDEAWATAGTATRPNATAVPRRRARHREERYAVRLVRLAKYCSS